MIARHLISTALAPISALALGILAAAESADPARSNNPGIKIDRGIHPPEPLSSLPKAGGVFVDPTFG